MTIHDATEQAFRNGYEKGKKEAVIHAHWENHQCTNCGAEAPIDTRLDFLTEEDCYFCYNCGAIMDEVVE